MSVATNNLTAKVCWLMERQVGIGSAAAALEPYLKPRAEVTWVDITYLKEGGVIERLALPGRAGGTLRGVLQSSEALRRGPFDALFFLTHNPAVMQQRAVARTPTLLWTDVTPALLDSQAAQYAHTVDSSRLTSFLKRALVKRTFNLAKLCVGWSEWARRSFVQDYGVPAERTAVVPPGINLAQWRPRARTFLGGLPRLLFVGGDFERKGGSLLLDTFRQHLRGKCELDIVTRDPLADEPGVTVHHGLTAGSEALLSLYEKASVFVLPTRGDCFSIASLEAMAVGLPVVVCDVGGIAEIVEQGETGYLIPPGDGRALLQALTPLLEDEGRRFAFGQSGRKRIEERFDAQTNALKLLTMLNEIARRH